MTPAPPADAPRSRARVVVVGATGFTGRLVARELAATGAEPLLTGRSPAKLSAVAAEAGGMPTRVLDVTEPAGLSRVFRRGDVVINCAGPFTVLGEPVVRASVAAGAHYLDTTGEQAFMKRVQDRYAEAARRAGVAVVNAMAFEYALGDFAARLAAEAFGPRRGTARELHLVYAFGGGYGPSSPGTRRSILHVLCSPAVVLEGGRWREERLGARRRRVALPNGRVARAYSFPAGEILTAPRHLQVQTVRGWMVLGRRSALLLRVAGVAPPLVRALRPLLERRARRGPEGPSAQDRARSTFTIVAEAVAREGTERRITTIQGRDSYGVTAALVVRGALKLAEGAPRAGVLAPSQLLQPGAALDALGALGLQWRVERAGG